MVETFNNRRGALALRRGTPAECGTGPGGDEHGAAENGLGFNGIWRV